jgi:signal transduction histidine kinase
VIELDPPVADALPGHLRRALAGYRTADQIYDAACALLRERLGEEALLACYIADGDVLSLRAQRGYLQAINWLLPDWGCFGAAYRLGSTMHLEQGAPEEEIFIQSAEDVEGIIAVPFTGGVVKGLLGLESPGRVDAALVAPMEDAAAAVEEAVAELPEADRQIAKGPQRLSRAFVQMASIRDPSALLELAARTIGEVLEMDVVQIGEIQQGELLPRATWRLRAGADRGLDVHHMRGVASDFGNGPSFTQFPRPDVSPITEQLREAGIGNVAGLPLRAGGRLIGYAVCTSRTGITVTPDRFEDAEMVALHAAALLDGLRSLGQVEQAFTDQRNLELVAAARAMQQQVVAHLGQQALEGQPADRLAEEAVAQIAAVLGLDHVTLFDLVERDTLQIRVAHGRGPAAAGTRLPVEPGSATPQILESGEPVVSPDVRAEERFEIPPTVLELGVSSALGVRLFAAGEPIGLLSAYSTEPRTFTEDDVHFAQSVANVIAAAIAAERADDALVESERHRLQVVNAMLRAGEEERSRIATDLHDDTVQVMTATLLTVDRLRNAIVTGDAERMVAVCEEVRRTLTQAMERTRLMMFDLRPPLLDAYGLEPAIRDMVEQAAEEAGFETVVEVRVARHHELLETLAYRTVREAVINARRHSGATRLEVRLDEENGRLRGLVRDDGAGFDVSEATGRGRLRLSLGLDALVERVRLAGGEVAIQSAPGQGAEVSFELPTANSRAAR